MSVGTGPVTHFNYVSVGICVSGDRSRDTLQLRVSGDRSRDTLQLYKMCQGTCPRWHNKCVKEPVPTDTLEAKLKAYQFIENSYGISVGHSRNVIHNGLYIQPFTVQFTIYFFITIFNVRRSKL